MEFELNLGNGIIRSYRRLSYKTWCALAEFIDNSTQSFAEHREELVAAGDVPPLEINIDYGRDQLRIHDTAMGMNQEELVRAMSLGIPPPNRTGRGEYGLGLKTAACWFGDLWTVTTKKFGDPNEYSVTVDVDRIAAGDTKLPTRVTPKPTILHYTTIDIQKLHHRYHPSTMKRVEIYIRSMYRLDLENADLFIRLNGGDPLTFEYDLPFLKAADGSDCKRPFDTTINGKRVRGWMGILNPAKRKKAGITIFRRGRAIMAYPETWRPQDIYGIQRNDRLNQRLVGEIHLDAFGVSHTKDEILWDDDEEHQIEAFLQDHFADYIRIARDSRLSDVGLQNPGPSPAEVQMGTTELREQMQTPEFADTVTLSEVPSPELVQAASVPLLEAARREEPATEIVIGSAPDQITCKIHINTTASANDPYFASSYGTNTILVSVNTQHPHWCRIRGGAQGVTTYLMECVYDALAEWKAMRHSIIRHDTVKLMKDRLLRHEIAMDSTETVEAEAEAEA
jgi:hypothetical protein